MANIFSGLFTQSSGSGAGKLAKYKFELEQYELELEKQRQRRANEGSASSLQTMIEGFGPERQNMANYFTDQLNYPSSYEQGNLGLTAMANDRGGMIAATEAQKQRSAEALLASQRKVAAATKAEAEDLAAKIAFQKYKTEFPEPTDLQQNLADYRALGDESGNLTTAQKETLEFKRSAKWFEQEDQFIKEWDRSQVISKRLLEGGITKKLVPQYATRLTDFFSTIDAAEETLNFAQNRRDDIQKLYRDTNDFTTGPGSLLAGFIFTDAADWKRLQETVISNIGLAKIMDLKAGSKQGATGLGALNEEELKMLQRHAGNLAAATNPAEMKRILRRLDRDLKNMQDMRMRGLLREKTFYNEYKQYLPYGNTEKYIPPPEVEHLFTGGEYIRPVIESPLDETREQRLERLIVGG